LTHPGLELFAPAGFPHIRPGDALDTIILDALESNGLSLRDGDILVLAQKIVSKAEGRYVRLAEVDVSRAAQDLAERCGKDPRLVELILRESERVVRCAPGVLIVRHRLGFVHANAGIDRSNIEQGDEQVLLLPEDPDSSAAQLRASIGGASGKDIGVLIIDSFGRSWRIGTCGVCIGSAGIEVIGDRRGQADLFGRTLEVTEVAVADELAAAASLLMGGAAESRPLVLARGLVIGGKETARDLLRPVAEDLFL
jgi:coenzyme F420-0:L-glutamate ligase/coenzyme F420-1:gamma-L-glutamate ligase